MVSEMKKPREVIYEAKWEEHLAAMRSGSEELLSALKREHPAIIHRLLRNRKEQP